jgi:hypothetical protein
MVCNKDRIHKAGLAKEMIFLVNYPPNLQTQSRGNTLPNSGSLYNVNLTKLNFNFFSRLITYNTTDVYVPLRSTDGTSHRVGYNDHHGRKQRWLPIQTLRKVDLFSGQRDH